MVYRKYLCDCPESVKLQTYTTCGGNKHTFIHLIFAISNAESVSTKVNVRVEDVDMNAVTISQLTTWCLSHSDSIVGQLEYFMVLLFFFNCFFKPIFLLYC